MANTDTSNSWEKIQRGVKDTERLIGQKDYNMALIKARQTLEYMVRCLGEKACIVDGDLSSMIDELYLGKWISKTTSEHYHKIRILGNKATHEGSNNAYDANQAYQFLSQEVYTFSNDYRVKRRRPSGSGSGSSSSQRNHGSRKRNQKKSGFALTQQDILKIVILILCIAFIAAVVKFIKPGKEDVPETTPTEPPTTTAQPIEETTPPETESVPPETMAPVIYKTTTGLNVRKEPSTDGEKLGLLPEGTEVTYKDAYDDDWAIIEYNGQEAYVASQYLTTE